MKRWETKIIDLGDVKVGTKSVVEFKSLGLLDIVDIVTSCGCTSAKYDVNTNTLSAMFKAESIPVHLSKEGQYTTEKFITVFYEGGEHERLSFKATVKRNL